MKYTDCKTKTYVKERWIEKLVYDLGALFPPRNLEYMEVASPLNHLCVINSSS